MGLSSSTARGGALQKSRDLTQRQTVVPATVVAPQTKCRAGSAALTSTSSVLLRDIQLLATLNDEYGDIADAAIYLQGNVIRWVGKTSAIPDQLQKADTVLSLPDRVVIPGLVCCHHHMYQVFPMP